MARPHVSTVIACSILLLVAYDIGLRRGESVRAASAQKVVAAQEFQVLGADGKVRARLTAANDRSSLVLYDGTEAARPRAVLGVAASGDPIFTLLDRDGRTPRVVADLTATADASSLAKTVRAGIHVYDPAGKALWSAP